MDKATPNNPAALYLAHAKAITVVAEELMAALKKLGERMAVLEEVTQEMRSELDDLNKADESWSGGTD